MIMRILFLRRKRLGKKTVTGIIDTVKSRAAAVLNTRMDRYKSPVDIVFRWGCTSSLKPEWRRAIVINKPSGIHAVADKVDFRRKLQDAGLCPQTWFEVPSTRELWVSRQVILRTNHHAQGKGLYFFDAERDGLADVIYQLHELYRRFGGDVYINKYIPKIAEYRVFVFNGRVMALTEKVPENVKDIAWNRAQGDNAFQNVKWSEWNTHVCDVAIKAAKLAGIDFTGVDVILDADGKAYVLEANSAPTCSPYRQGLVAKILDWSIDNKQYNIGDRKFNSINCQGGNTWKDYIHPALTDKAVV